MRNTDFLRLSGLVYALLLALGGSFSGCGEDAAGPPRTGSDAKSASDDEADDEESPTKPSEGTDPDSPAASGSIDAGATGVRKDAGSTPAPVTDAAAPKADAASKPADAATASLDAAQPAATDAAIDGGGASLPNGDAATAAVDGSVVGPAPHTFKVDSKAEWAASGFKVEAGRCYTIEAKIDDQWLDLDVPADFSGWKNKNDARLGLFAPFRRVVQADIGFYQFATCVNKKLDQCFPVGTSSSVCPKTAGELFFFVNDVAGFESNNVGTATVSINAK